MDSNSSSEDRMLDLLEAYDRALAAGRSATTVDDRALPEELKPQVAGARNCLELLEAAFPRAQRDTVSYAGDSSRITTTDFEPRPLPACIGRYKVLEELGRGGMGVVYLADDPALRRQVAVKVIRAAEFASHQELTRFRSEAQAVARLKHPNIVEIHDIDDHSGLPFLVLEYIAGGNLAKLIAGKPQPPLRAAELVETLARAMHHVHQEKIVHRDLKPSNVLLSQKSNVQSPTSDETPVVAELLTLDLESWTPKVADFGLATELDADATRTGTGAIMGTPPYMAPEQANGRVHAISPRTDIYALGTILYELVTGCPPFRGDSKEAILQQVRLQEPVPPRRLQPSVPRDLEKICLKCLYKDPKDRYESAAALAEDLARWQRAEPIHAKPELWAKRLLRSVQRHRVALLAASVLLLFSVWIAVPGKPEGKKSADPPALDPALAFIQDELALGRPIELLGPVGRPPYFRFKYGVADLSASETDPLSITSVSPVLLELVSDPKIDRFRLRAEVYCPGDQFATAGLYFAHRPRDTDQGREQWFCSMYYHDATARGWAVVAAHRYGEPSLENRPSYNDSHTGVGIAFVGDLKEMRNPVLGATGVGLLFSPRGQGLWLSTSALSGGVGGAIPWRKLSVSVSPAGISALWDGKDLGAASRADLAKRDKMMLGQIPLADGPPPHEYSPAGSVGLFVRHGTASFRNVWIEPIP